MNGIRGVIQTLADYLDLGKRIATTIPGIVLALTVLWLYTSSPSYRSRRELARQVDNIRQQELGLEIRTLQQKLSAASSGAADVRTVDTALADVRSRIESNREAWKDLEGGYDSFFQNGFTSVLVFGLFAFAIGAVLDPVNHALFLELIPEIGAREGSKLAYLSGYRILDRARRRLVERYEGHPIAARVGALNPLHIGATFYIGRGLITQAEYDDLVSRYYRFTEISIGMIIPTLAATGGAIYVFSDAGLRVGIAAAGLLATFGLHQLGIKRYADFRAQVFDLIAGREAAHKDAAITLPSGQIELLARVLRRVEEVVGQSRGGLEPE